MASVYGLKTGQLKAQQSLTIEGANSETMGSKTCEYLALAGEGMALAEQLPTPPEYASDNLSKPPKQGIRKINIARQAGGVELVTVSWTAKYVTEDEEDTGGDGGGGETTMPSKSVKIATSLTEEPIFQHPKFKAEVDKLDEDTVASLNALANGEKRDEKGNVHLDILKGKVSTTLLNYLLKGVTHYYSPKVQVSMSFEGNRTIPEVGQIVENYSGLPGLKDGLKWLSMGGGTSRTDGKTTTDMSFMAGVWDEFLY